MKTMMNALNAKGNVYAQDQANAAAANGTGECLLIDGTVELTAEEISGLLFMIEEEKMAMDLYDSFAEQTGATIFDRISASEDRHMTSLINVAEAADVDLSTLSTEVGVFSDAHIQELYDSLLTQGSASLADAIQVGILVEETDIQDLQDYNADEIGILGTIYSHLETGSEHHLAAFTQYEAVA